MELDKDPVLRVMRKENDLVAYSSALIGESRQDIS